MREYVPIILAAALIMGMAGTFLAKSARKKSSYPLLITSAAMAIITFAGIIFSAAALFFPEKITAESTVPAIMYEKATGEWKNTSLTFEGEWTYSNIFKRNKNYCGSIEIEALEYTKYEGAEIELDFEYFSKEKDTLYAGYFYNAPEEAAASAGFWTDEKGSWFYIDTQSGENSGEYIIIAPAETDEEAYAICEIAGTSYPDK